MIAASGDSGVLPRGLRAVIVVALVGANLLIQGFSAYSLYLSRQRHEAQARAQAENMVEAIDQSVVSSIERMDLALQAMVRKLEGDLATGGLDARQVEHMLAWYQTRLPEVEGIRMTNAQGLVIFGKGVDRKTPTYWADRRPFAHLRDHADGGLQVADPIMGRVAKRMIMPFYRRYNHPDGSFAGVISVAVALEHYAELLAKFNAGPHGSLVLRGGDLGLIARYPKISDQPAGQIGNADVSRELRELAAAGMTQATYHARVTSDGIERIISFRRIRLAPMMVLAGVASEDYLAEWRGDVYRTAGMLAVLALLSLLSGSLLLFLLGRITRESKRNSLFLHHASDGIHILDEQGRLMQASDRFCAMLGYRLDEVVGMHVSDWEACWSPELLRNKFYPELLRRTETYTFESVHRRKDGGLLEVELSVVGFNLDGQRCLYAASRDISEKKRHQRELRESEARLRLAASVFSHAHESIMITDAGRAIVDVNPTFSEITGYARDEVIGRTPGFLGSGRHDAEFFRSMWQVIERVGHWQGEVWNRRKDGRTYAVRLTISSVQDEEGRVTHYIGTFSDISALKEHQAQLEYLAHYDALTQLPNRALLSDRMAQALAQARRAATLVAVCYLDLDGFKEINDRHGHDAGDIMLIEVARRLRETVRAGDTVARLGGDEFVLLLLGINDVGECERAVARVLRAIPAPIRIKGNNCSVSGSLGIALYPHDDSDPDTLLRHADQAMYAAKQGGKNGYQMYDLGSDRRVRSQRDIRDRLGRALAGGEFCLHYQPIVDMRKGLVVGLEGLIRWQHPERGLLLPAELFPLLENSDLEIELGRWVFAEGVRQLAVWRESGFTHTLSLNVSVRHLLSPGFVDDLQAVLARHPVLEPGALELEVMETAAVIDIDSIIGVFKRCQEAGVGIALDDFGTGYSSLSFFRRLPVNTVKIDRIFVQSIVGNAEDLAIVTSVINLTRSFKRKLVAEGVETVEIGMLLLGMGCDVGQGYGIARPMPAAAVPDWISGFVPDPDWACPIACFNQEDMPLYMAELEHRSWVRSLEEWLQGDSEKAPPPLDIRRCRFGQWYSGECSQHYSRFGDFEALGLAHEAVHKLAQDLADMHRAGRSAEARSRFGEMLGLRDRLITCLGNLQAEIVIEKM